MKVGVVREIAPGERRVALVPESVARLVKAGHQVEVQAGAGKGAHLPDSAYREAGAELVGEAAGILSRAQAVLKVQRPSLAEAQGLQEGAVLVASISLTADVELIRALAARKVSAFSMDRIPRITRAQSMDSLSSQSNIAGYKAVLIAANSFDRLFPLLMTAAGTLTPAKVFVLGAGVAGLQAIATARRLGAVVSAFDVRPAVKEQVESLGARFLSVDLGQADTQDKGGYAKQLSEESHRREEELLHQALREMDVVITTALIPGKPAPRLITEAMVKDMRPGSVIVDLAAEAGGNCELTRAGEVTVRHGVTIHGPVNLPSSVAAHSSQMFSRNILTFFQSLVKDGTLHLDFQDEIVRATCLTHGGEVREGR